MVTHGQPDRGATWGGAGYRCRWAQPPKQSVTRSSHVMEQDRYLHALDARRVALETGTGDSDSTIPVLSRNFPLSGAPWAEIGVLG